MLKLQTSNNCTCAIQETRTPSCLILTTSEKSIQTAQEPSSTKAIAHHRMLLPPSVPLLTDGAEAVSFRILCCPHKDHWLAIRPSITSAREDTFQEPWTMLKYTGSLMKNVSPTAPMSPLHNNAKRKLPPAKSSKSLIIVFQRIWKTSSKKSSTTVQSLPLFQFTEILSFTKRDCIKSTHETKDSPLARLSSSSVGMSEMAKLAGLLKTVGVKTGEKKESRNYFS